MNLDKIREKLDSLQSNNQQREKKDFSKIFWTPELGKATVRIVPSTFNSDYPFTELKFHYGVGKYPIVALTNFGKQDPVEEFIAELKKTDDKDNWSLAGKLSPKTRIFAPVVVRGEEDKGVRLWGFGVTIYKALLALAEDEDIGDFTDVTQGWDLVVEKVKGNPYPETTVRIKPKQTPLSKESSEVEKWLKEQPDPKDSHNQYDYEFIKKQLDNYLHPDKEDSEEVQSPTKSEDSSFEKTIGSHKTDFTTETVLKDNKDLGSKFDDLFN